MIQFRKSKRSSQKQSNPPPGLPKWMIKSSTCTKLQSEFFAFTMDAQVYIILTFSRQCNSVELLDVSGMGNIKLAMYIIMSYYFIQ